MDAIKEWWAQAPARDQMALVLGLGFLILYILFMGVLKPVYNMRADEEVKNNSLRGSLERVRTLAAQVAAQKESGGSGKSRGSLENIVQQTVSANGLQVSSMAASGQTGVRIRFDEARFQNVLTWLYEMEVSNNLQVRDLSVSPGSNPGLVTVNLRLHQD